MGPQRVYENDEDFLTRNANSQSEGGNQDSLAAPKEEDIVAKFAQVTALPPCSTAYA